MIGLGRWSVYRVRTSLLAIVWDRHKVIDLWEWLICGGDRLGRFYCKCDVKAILVSSLDATPLAAIFKPLHSLFTQLIHPFPTRHMYIGCQSNPFLGSQDQIITDSLGTIFKSQLSLFRQLLHL